MRPKRWQSGKILTAATALAIAGIGCSIGAAAQAQNIEPLPRPVVQPVQEAQTTVSDGNIPNLTPPPVSAAPRIGEYLTLDALLESSARHAPQILEALADAQAANARITAAQGAFDLVFNAESYSYLSGFYGGQYVNATASQPLTNNGGSIEVGYRNSQGRFPTYNDFFFTNQVGELKARGVYSLLRDNMIDDRRFGERNARLNARVAEIETNIVAIGVQQRAIEAYNNWVAAAQQLRIYRELLKLANDRQSGLVRQVQLGAQADIILTENQQNILRRQTLLVQAERNLQQAANRLSLFWRDDEGRPLQPDPNLIPDDLPQIYRNGDETIEDVLARRPDIKIVETRLEQARLRLQLDENLLRPRFDVFAEASNDFGSIGAGGPSRDGFETLVGVRFSVPLQRREARGRIAATQAEMEATRRARQQVAERVENTINDIIIDLRAAENLLQIARDEERAAEIMAAGERRLFRAGASDFFLVNLREEAAANASIRRLQAEFNLAAARADLAAASADFATLGLESGIGILP
ncbi:TolC family protein [Alterisphingorhabdus coralli]|uniref:TolC family protein n=1 Tax=Alterisphingorhabdus coralli TaxID=3071408 RepID=A0AA97F662_9SPHN|nr:TolC family protein [Parasphingorhabdus sp. SCSIO 66989]WOE74951.1 TolC family protein [Parasphingorhabdus sp. SCSIO 66989]